MKKKFIVAGMIFEAEEKDLIPDWPLEPKLNRFIGAWNPIPAKQYGFLYDTPRNQRRILELNLKLGVFD